MTPTPLPIASTRSGQVQGIHEHGLFIFKGIPYAAAPVGNLRWMRPQPHLPWSGTFSARTFGPIAPQNLMPGNQIETLNVTGEQSEDCLYLNIWTPGLDSAQRPVMVWIHGGAFILGAGSQSMFDGAHLARQGNVVLVTINYRMGALGFMNLDQVTHGAIPATGNEGLLDQLAALVWVQDNIAAFGGDPSNITVFGESAGAMSIGCLLSMPEAKSKFQKAILQSGAGNTVGALEGAVDITRQFLEIVKVPSSDTEGLRALTTHQLMAAQQALQIQLMVKEHRITPFQPVVDGVVIPDLPIKRIQWGSAGQVKVLAGTNRDEWKLFAMMEPDFYAMSEEALHQRLAAILTPQNPIPIIETYRSARSRRGEPTTPAELLVAIQTDLMFRVPSVQLVEALTRQDQTAYSYLFSWPSPTFGGILGAAHGLEIGFVFGRYDDAFCGSGPDADRLANTIQQAWIAFARYGDPSRNSQLAWPTYGTDRNTMILDRTCRITTAPLEEERQIWDRLSLVFTKPI